MPSGGIVCPPPWGWLPGPKFPGYNPCVFLLAFPANVALN